MWQKVIDEAHRESPFADELAKWSNGSYSSPAAFPFVVNGGSVINTF